MGRRVEVQDGESIERALFRLRVAQAYEYKRWTKKRYGYFEKPSALRRKREKMAKIWSILEAADRRAHRGGSSAKSRIHLFVGVPQLFARSGPTNEAGR
ncbi:MAG: ribosomal protein S21 [Rudaea sp.]|nr:ribosomal protein S21 [Rudaea sp.]MBR0344862.1 ribosomal protein S21 [Rudaea sp.]